MSAKDYVKSLTAEIIGLGIDKSALTDPTTAGSDGQALPDVQSAGTPADLASPGKRDATAGAEFDTAKVADMLGHATLEAWGQLPRDAQETIFESAVRARPEWRTDLATFLHEIHPRTMHAPQEDGRAPPSR